MKLPRIPRPKVNFSNWRTWLVYCTVCLGGFLAGGLSATYPPAWVPMPQRQAVAVQPVKTASIDLTARSACNASIDEIAKLRREISEWAKAKVAPSKVQGSAPK